MKFLVLPFSLLISFVAVATSQIPTELLGTYVFKESAGYSCWDQLLLEDVNGDLRVAYYNAESLRDKNPIYEVHKNINGKPVIETRKVVGETSFSETTKSQTTLTADASGIHFEISIASKFKPSLRPQDGYDLVRLPVVAAQNLFKGYKKEEPIKLDFDRETKTLRNSICTWQKL